MPHVANLLLPKKIQKAGEPSIRRRRRKHPLIQRLVVTTTPQQASLKPPPRPGTRFLRALPLRKHAPPRTAICEDEAAPRALLADLNNRLPRGAVGVVERADELALAGQADDFAAGGLDGEFSGLEAAAAVGAG
ncbi:hypothetical protein OPT61_g10667 [Boeremia exigua]|uniref:Uncharacterized protein n=1 Tax=Boeremia exigua TaxID=749465 RepID=A0ACC2HPB2_9PLEO|nr:hypothetical protein OPT61_g10667 [Boeremia exigua]